MPALAVTRPDLASVLKAGLQIRIGRRRRFGLRNLFVVYQVAAAMTLIMIMGFTVIALHSGIGRDAGFDPAPVSLFSLDPMRDGYSPAQAAALFAALPEKLKHLAGVESVSLAAQPLADALPNTAVAVGNAVHTVVLHKIGPQFFATLGVPVLRGAEFQERELRSVPVPGAGVPVVINRTAARELFGGADPLGRSIRQEKSTFQVIGIVRYDRPMILINRPVATVFLPLTAMDLREATADGITVVVRSRAGVDLQAIRREVAVIGARLTVFNRQTMRKHLAELDRSTQLATATYLPIGLFGLVLACLGLAGVTAQAAEQRRKEIGIRMALGARRAQLLRLVMREGTVMVSVGAAFGLAGAYAVARILAATYAPIAQFIGWGSGNPALTLGVPSLLISLAAFACYLPARRSASVDPLIALREE